jgi:hypothetical protein
MSDFGGSGMPSFHFRGVTPGHSTVCFGTRYPFGVALVRRALRALAGTAVLALSCGLPALPAQPAPAILLEGSPFRRLALPIRVIDLAFIGKDRLVALSAEEVLLLAIGRDALTVLSRRLLPGPLEVVRTPGALLQASEQDGAVWAMTSRSRRAVLFALERDGLAERDLAEALPFPGCARGLRFRPGTNLIEGELQGIGSGPFLDLAVSETVVAVSADGRLLSPALAA